MAQTHKDNIEAMKVGKCDICGSDDVVCVATISGGGRKMSCVDHMEEIGVKKYKTAPGGNNE